MNYLYKIFTLSLILLLGSFTLSYAQITGTTSVQANSTHTYQFNNGQSQYPNNWIISGGTLMSSWKSGSTYYVSAKWDGGMSNGTVVFTSTNNYLYVSIASSAPSTPSTPTIQSTNCGNTVLARGNPPSGVTWYWQSTSSGTSTSNSSTTITKTSGTTQYLRARNSSGTWSSSSSNKSYSINTVPATPSTPTVVNDCGSAVLTKGSSPSGITWYWQSSSSGTSTSNSMTTISRTSGTVYYLRARNNSSGCWSSARTVNYSINSVPSIPSTPTVTNNCGSSILTKGSSPSGITWYWQSSSNGTSTSSSSTSITRTSGTVYYLRARNNSSGCWSSTRTVNYSIKSVPATPSIPTITNNCGSTVLTRGSHPSGQTLYWQSSSGGTSTSNSGSTVTRTSGTVYYLRSRNNSSGCWSSARTINYSVNNVPGTPSTPTITNNCGSTVLTRGSHPSGQTLYWQSSSGGTSIGNSGSTVTRTTGTVYYLRSRNNSSGCWSSARTINYSINSVPGTPSTPTITNNCGSTVLTRGSHPSGQTLYWQSSSGGTSTGNSGSTVTRTSGTVYYLRSRNNSSGCWSSARTINYSINSVPGTPSTPTITNNCGTTVLTRGSHPSGQTLYWQSSSGGTSTGNSGSTVTRTSGTVYYLRSRNNSSGCWSSARTINYSINSVPATPSIPTITNNCGSTVLTRGSHPSGQTLYWQSSSGGTSTGNSGSTVTRTSGTVYYLRSRNNTTGCWSSTRTVNYSINSVPGTPSTPTITNNCGSTVLTRGSHPSGQTLYWQSSSGGTSTGNSGSTVTRTSGTVYYLRSRNNSSGCWSSARTINYSINSVPGTPSTPTITNNCGSTVLTRGSHPSGQTLYWQSSSGGTSTGNSGSTVTRTTGTVYYLRARNNSSGCWSSARTVNYTINPGPIWYADTDGDGFGDPNATQRSCTRPVGYVENKDDQAINTPGTNFGTTSNIYTSATKSDENYIYTRSYQNPMDSPNDINNNNDVIEQITYFDGLGRPMQNIAIKASGSEASQLNLQANIPEWSMDWTSGSGSTSFFNQNGTTSENLRINGADPHGNISLLWECGNEADNSSDGGWNTDYFNVDKNSTYRYTVWVKRNYSSNGSTYHGTQNVNNLSGSANGNPYFWSGDLPQLNQWYLLVGIVHPVGYSGGDTGVSGVYDLQGNRVIDGNEFTWRSDTSTSRFRSYLYYATDVSVRQYFYAPVVQQINGSENSIAEIISGTEGQGGPLTDIVTHIGYDDFGRQDKNWLPYHETTGSVGSYRGDKSLATQQYYQTNYADDFPGITNAQDINAYSQKGIESSPLNRVLEQAAPGEAWKLGGGHEIEFNYQSNTHDALNPTDATKDNVKLFKVSLTLANNTYTPTLVDGGYYEAHNLYKTTTKDENHSGALKDHTTEEFKDKQGRVLLKRTYNAEVEHDTYYVYDDYGNLTYVLPPLMNASTTSLATINTQMNNLGYQYKYDSRNRLVEKRIPGKDWEYIVYDNLDRPVLTQDANLRDDDKWLFTKYDAFGRVAYTGIHTNASHTGRTSMQSNFNTQNNTPAELFESKDSNGTGYDNSYYTNANFPNTNIVLHTVNYYDDYNFDKVGLVLPEYVFGKTVVNYIDTDKTKTKGLATGSRVRVLNVSPAKWITTVTGYNVKGQPIYMASYNAYLETTDTVKSEFDFVGKVTKMVTDHSKGVTAVTTEDLFTYDHVGRLKKQAQELNNTDVLEVLVENTYDNLGQLTSKAVGGKTTQGRLQNVDYTYNVRGWLKQINNPTTLGNDLFSFKINYNTNNHGGTSLFNGNIAETEWKTANTDNSLKWYKYSYDALNRITSGLANSSNYNLTSVSYDKNGNINNLVRQGVRAMSGSTVTSYGEMDNLTYTYQSNSNKLLKVTDAATLDQYGFIDDAENTAPDSIDDYTYDANGNMLTDQNKGITNITYNHLNLPTGISINGNGNVGAISYIYDATGIKLKKIVSTGATTEYAGNYVYEGSSLKFFNHPEGYVDVNGSSYSYVYQYKDHLGNVRLSYKDSNNDGEITGASTQVFFDDFENSIQGVDWNGSGHTWGWDVDEFDSNFKFQGNYSARLDTHSHWENVAHSNEWIQINNTVTTDYIYSGWVFLEDVSGNQADIFLFMNEPGETGYYTLLDSQTTYTRGTWVYLEKQVSVPSNITQLNLRIDNDHAGKVWFDNVSIRKVNDPAIVEILEENNYYPFGLKHKGYNNNPTASGIASKYKTYQGQEITDELGLNMHEFKYRFYDASIGRFWSTDPLAATYVNNSPYAFSENKLGMGMEMEGLEIVPNEVTMWLSIKAAELKAKWNGGTEKISQASSELMQMKMSVGEPSFDSEQAKREAQHKLLSGIGDVSEVITDTGHVALEGIGIVDPTGIADAINAAWYAGEGRYAQASLSAISILPYLGDAIGKGGKGLLILGKAHKISKYANETEGAAHMFKEGFGLGISGMSEANTIMSAMYQTVDNGGKLLFDLGDVSLDAAKNGFKSYDAAAEAGKITEWELSKVLRDKDLFKSAVFHIDGAYKSASDLGLKLID